MYQTQTPTASNTAATRASKRQRLILTPFYLPLPEYAKRLELRSAFIRAFTYEYRRAPVRAAPKCLRPAALSKKNVTQRLGSFTEQIAETAWRSAER